MMLVTLVPMLAPMIMGMAVLFRASNKGTPMKLSEGIGGAALRHKASLLTFLKCLNSVLNVKPKALVGALFVILKKTSPIFRFKL